MIKAYLAWISTPYEGEDMEIRYKVYRDEELLLEESRFEDYCKPALCGLVSVEELLKDLEEHRDEEILIVINDGATYEILKNVSMTKKREVIDRGKETREKMEIFSNLDIQNVSGDHEEMLIWNKILTA